MHKLPRLEKTRLLGFKFDVKLNSKARGERDLEKETTVAKRKDESTEAGPISGTSEDSLYTHGLASCIGIGAVGNPPLIGSRIDKVRTLSLVIPCDIQQKVAH